MKETTRQRKEAIFGLKEACSKQWISSAILPPTDKSWGEVVADGVAEICFPGICRFIIAALLYFRPT